MNGACCLLAHQTTGLSYFWSLLCKSLSLGVRYILLLGQHALLLLFAVWHTIFCRYPRKLSAVCTAMPHGTLTLRHSVQRHLCGRSDGVRVRHHCKLRCRQETHMNILCYIRPSISSACVVPATLQSFADSHLHSHIRRSHCPHGFVQPLCEQQDLRM